MTDRRFNFSNDRVTAPGHNGPESSEEREPQDYVVTRPALDLLVAPEGARDRQLLFNEVVDVLEIRDGFAFVRSGATGYVGYVDATALQRAPTEPVPDHWVCTRLTHSYSEPDIKSKERFALSLGTQLSLTAEKADMVKTEAGWVPSSHLTSSVIRDPVVVAERLLGTPYLWGGNSAQGIDCSGLTWIAFALCGAILKPDSDLQKKHDGTSVDKDTVMRGDLWFWDGHVALVADAQTLIHANAFHMAVVYEDIDNALARIGATTARKRVSLPTE